MGISVEKTTLMSVNRPLIGSLIGSLMNIGRNGRIGKGLLGVFVVEKENVARAPN